MTPLEEAQSAMHRLLAEHGAWSPLELLLATNKLHYDDYHAWLRGERATLDGDFADGPSDTRGLLRDLHVSAQALKLQPQAITVYGIEGNTGAELRVSADASLDELLRTKFQAADGRAQLDLFMDTEGVDRRKRRGGGTAGARRQDGRRALAAAGGHQPGALGSAGCDDARRRPQGRARTARRRQATAQHA